MQAAYGGQPGNGYPYQAANGYMAMNQPYQQRQQQQYYQQQMAQPQPAYPQNPHSPYPSNGYYDGTPHHQPAPMTPQNYYNNTPYNQPQAFPTPGPQLGAHLKHSHSDERKRSKRRKHQTGRPATPVPVEHEQMYDGGGGTLVRHRTISNGQQMVQVPRKAHYDYDYHDRSYEEDASPFAHCLVYLSFHGHDVMEIENLTREWVDEVKEKILPLWKPQVTSEIIHNRWRIRFADSPWRCDGSDDLEAMHLINQLVRLLAFRGFAFKTVLHNRNTPPRLVFGAAASEEIGPNPRFFLAYLSSSGRRLTLIGAPEGVFQHLWQKLLQVLPNRVVPDDTQRRGTSTLVLIKPRLLGEKEDKNLFMTTVMQELYEFFPIYMTIPLGLRPFGLGFKRELLVFKRR